MSYLKDIGEFGFIRKISPGCLIQPQHVIKAIGDDAAVFKTDSEDAVLVTTDLLVEQVHFLKHVTSGFNLGYKALAVNLSDIAAMGGTAKQCFVSLAVPVDCDLEYLEDLYNGIKSLGAEFDVNILGGDTTSSKAGLIINITVIGAAPENEILYRHTAKPGDKVYSTGFLGDSRAGLYLILNTISADSEELKTLFTAHILPRPYLEEGRFLACQNGVHAAIDVSDGLSSDIGHITEESNTGVRLYAEKIPISPQLHRFCSQFDFNPIEYAMNGGEDYTLLCTISSDTADKIAQAYLEKFNHPLCFIGEITENSGIKEMVFPDGQIRKFTSSGWDHFFSFPSGMNDKW